MSQRRLLEKAIFFGYWQWWKKARWRFFCSEFEFADQDWREMHKADYLFSDFPAFYCEVCFTVPPSSMRAAVYLVGKPVNRALVPVQPPFLA
jgi:hypothetical protein